MADTEQDPLLDLTFGLIDGLDRDRKRIEDSIQNARNKLMDEALDALIEGTDALAGFQYRNPPDFREVERLLRKMTFVAKGLSHELERNNYKSEEKPQKPTPWF